MQLCGEVATVLPKSKVKRERHSYLYKAYTAFFLYSFNDIVTVTKTVVTTKHNKWKIQMELVRCPQEQEQAIWNSFIRTTSNSCASGCTQGELAVTLDVHLKNRERDKAHPNKIRISQKK
jgi:hypothetical protein